MLGMNIGLTVMGSVKALNTLSGNELEHLYSTANPQLVEGIHLLLVQVCHIQSSSTLLPLHSLLASLTASAALTATAALINVGGGLDAASILPQPDYLC